MSASVGIAGFGSKLNWDGVDIAELTNIGGPNESAATVELTSHDSDDAYQEFVAGLRNGGEISFEGNLIPTDTTGQIAMHTDFQAGSAKTLIITLPDSLGTITGTAICTKFEFSFPHDGPARISGSCKFSGKPTLAIS